MQKLSESLNSAYCSLALWLANGSVGDPVLRGVDYRVIFTEPSGLQQAFAVTETYYAWTTQGMF